MTINETYDYLMQLRRIDKGICAKYEKIRSLKNSLLPIGIRYDLDKVLTSPDDRVSKIMADISELECQIESLKAERLVAEAHLREGIEKLEDETEQAVLCVCYIDKSQKGRMKGLAGRLGYSRSAVYKIRDAAVKKLSEIL